MTRSGPASTTGRVWLGTALAIALIIIVGLVVAAYDLIEPSHLDGNLITALFTAVAAVAASASAFAALVSARESSQTARDAIRALSLTSKPTPSLRLLTIHPDGDDLGGVFLEVVNDSIHALDRGTVRWHLHDDSRGHAAIDRIAGMNVAHSGFSIPLAPRTTIPLGPVPKNPPVDLDEVTLEFWGANGPTGWRLSQKFDMAQSEENRLPPYRGRVAAAREPIETELF